MGNAISLARSAKHLDNNAFELDQAVFRHRRKAFYVADKLQSLAGNANSYNRTAKCLTRNVFWFAFKRTPL
ncbi:hypothetical protein [Methylomonas methanica]|uniref:hypothetical protein n=1 Tax=Methylomonas methanica TaxID=421 RepID=UPI001A9DB097|nr:hypothetical protein [Methylomonas methanica]